MTTAICLLVGGLKTILKNDGARQWEGLSIPYIMENNPNV